MRLTVPHLLLILVAVVAVASFFPREAFSVPYVGPAPFSLEPFQASPAQPAQPTPQRPSLSTPAPVAAARASNGVFSSVVPVSDTAYDAMSLKQRSDLLSQIQRTVRDELLAARRQPVGKDCDSDSDNDTSCPSEKQGQDYDYRCPKNLDGSCPPVPDLTQYIRKDQIPCWGCAVDF